MCINKYTKQIIQAGKKVTPMTNSNPQEIPKIDKGNYIGDI